MGVRVMEDLNETDEKIKTKNFKPIHVIVGIVLILILSYGGTFLIGKTILNPQDADANQKNELGPLYDSPKFTVNLANTNGRRFLMTQFALEVDDKKVLKELAEKTPVIQDKVIIVLSSQTIDDLNSPHGKEKIKQQLKDNINSVLVNGRVINIYFNNFVWQ